ncbi:MAG TPA: hypothetical protein DEQ47_06735 [Solibacterales bacterium]|nr:hypothetical protein [Bryobacterales bacterium]
MAPVNVTLRYEGSTFTPPDPIQVDQNDTIHFLLPPGSPATHTLRITLKNPQPFSRGRFLTGEDPITVKHKLAGSTTYHCELFDGDPANNVVLAHSAEDGSDGGRIDPA